MKKGILIGLLSFLLGITAAVAILLNPMGWSWAGNAHHYVLAAFQKVEPSGAEGEGEQLYTCGMHPQVIQDHPGTCPICGMDLIPLKSSTGGSKDATKKTEPSGERKILYYRAPMDPTYTSDKPGKSPMGMDLVPVYADEQGAEKPKNTVHIDPSFVQTIGVQTAVVKRQDIPYTVRTVGNISYNDEQLHWVTTKYEGWIEKVYVNYVGEPVEKGQKLFEIYSPQLVTTQKEYLDALEYAERLSTGDYEDVKRRARALLESTRERLAYWDISAKQIEALEKTRQLRRTLTVFSPTDGMVVDKMNQSLEGMYVKPGMNLYKIVDLSTIWVEAEVFENQIPWLKIGQSALLEFPYQPGRKYRARVRFIYPYFNDKTRTMKLSLSLPNPGLEFRKDMYVDVTFNVPSAHNVIAVPEEAVIFSGTRNLVVTSIAEGEFQVKNVTLGLHGEGLYEVKSGLKEGETIVTSSQFLIDSESSLKEAIQKMVADRKSGKANSQTSDTESSETSSAPMNMPREKHEPPQ
jgi:Cu(I)/Ag(I) efflux system membrane fusion protein/cobalt-zinc-cadmium efflux system membrane fusion protein